MRELSIAECAGDGRGGCVWGLFCEGDGGETGSFMLGGKVPDSGVFTAEDV